MIRDWRRRRRERIAKERSMADFLATAATLSTRIEQTAASFGSRRLFDERYGRIELDALTIRKRAECVSGVPNSHPPTKDAA